MVIYKDEKLSLSLCIIQYSNRANMFHTIKRVRHIDCLQNHITLPTYLDSPQRASKSTFQRHDCHRRMHGVIVVIDLWQRVPQIQPFVGVRGVAALILVG